MPESWQFQNTGLPVAEFHSATHPGRRAVWCHVWSETESVLVLGSTQRFSVVNEVALERQNIMLVRRQSGGGAVLLEPESAVWIDVFLPAGDRLMTDDLSSSAIWLGELWQEVLGELGVEADVYSGAFQPGKWGKLICFSSRVAGEVLVGGRAPAKAAAKTVGISQRRTRVGARFQSALLLEWDPEKLASLFSVADSETLAQEIADDAKPLRLPPQEVIRVFTQKIQTR